MNTHGHDIHGAIFMANALVAAIGVAWRLLAPAAWRSTGLLLMGAGWTGCAATIAADHAPIHPLVGVASVLISAAMAWLVSRVFVSRVSWLVVAGAVAVPIRIAIPVDGNTANLLLPLYVVLGVALATHIRRELRLTTPPPAQRLPTDVVVAAMTVWCALSFMWTYAPAAAAIDLALFVIPFASLYVLLRDWLSTNDASLRWPAISSIGTMTVAAVIAIYQHASHTVWTNAKVIVANQYAPDFRVNSFFWDPNMFGRYLVASLLIIGAVLMSQRHMHRPLLAGATITTALMGTALWYTYSQSSLIALAAGCIVLVFIGSRRVMRSAIVGALLVLLACTPVALHHLGGKDTQGRESIIAGGVKLSSLHPVRGIGIGSFEDGIVQVARDRGESVPKLRSSHTAPVTVFVELGVIGLAILIVMYVAGIDGLARSGHPDPSRWWAIAVYVALIVHSMFYAAFIEDPLTWVALAVVAAYRLGGSSPSSTTTTVGWDAPHSHPTPVTGAHTHAAPHGD